MKKNKKYLITETNIDPQYGKFSFIHWELFDGPIEAYMKSKDFIVKEIGAEMESTGKD